MYHGDAKMSESSQVKQKEYLIEINLITNPRACRFKGFVMRIKENGEAEYLKADIPEFAKGLLVGGKYLLRENDIIIVRSDDSSHKNSRQYYTLYKVSNGDLQKLAEISYHNDSPSFSLPELEMIFARKRKPIDTLIEFVKEKGYI